MGDLNREVIRLHPDDNVVVLTREAAAGESLSIDGQELLCPTDLGFGHKLASRDLASGEKVVKYGAPIGSTTRRIRRGEHVHTHNMKSDFLEREARGPENA